MAERVEVIREGRQFLTEEGRHRLKAAVAQKRAHEAVLREQYNRVMYDALLRLENDEIARAS